MTVSGDLPLLRVWQLCLRGPRDCRSNFDPSNLPPTKSYINDLHQHTMSLFASAFDTGSGASGSRPLGGSPAGKKRKRPSLGSGKEDQLRATQANLAKLMARVEEGAADKGGKEALGDLSSVKSKGKGKNKKGGAGGAGSDEDEPAPKRAAPHAKAKGAKAKGAKGTKWAESDDASGSGANNVAVAPSARFSGAKAARGKPEPFDLPMPFMPKKKDEGDGLTDMQRGMKTKLEGARFR